MTTPERLKCSRTYTAAATNGLRVFRICEFGKYKNIFESVELYERWLNELKANDCAFYVKFLTPLIGFNLACYCRIGEPCHGDVLLRHVGELDKLKIQNEQNEQNEKTRIA